MHRVVTTQWLARQHYLQQWQAMQHHAAQLALGQVNEIIWGCEHEPIYTTGTRGMDNRFICDGVTSRFGNIWHC